MPIGGVSARVAIDATGFLSMAKWSVDIPSEAAEYVSTATSKGKARLAGQKDWTGQVDGYGHTPVVKMGESFTFHGSVDGVKGVYGDAICSGVAIVLAHESATDPIKYTMTFEGNGDLSFGAEAGVADASQVGPFSAVGLPFKYTAVETATPSEVSLADVRSINLTLTNALQSYASSSTSGIRKRILGPFDLECSVDAYIPADPASIPIRGAMYSIKVYATASTFWDIKYALLTNISDVVVDRETGAVVSMVLTFAFSAVGMVGAAPGTPTIGAVKDPATATWWP